MTRAFATPWAPHGAAYSLPGSMILKLALGEAPASVPTLRDVRDGRHAPAAGLDGGVVDRLLATHAGDVRITRLYGSAAGLARPGARHTGYDDVEQVTGLARTFRVQMDTHAPIGHLLEHLRQVAVVEAASHNYACTVPFDLAATALPDADMRWSPRDLIGAAPAMAYEPGDPSVVIGLIDSGVAPDHPELAGRLRAGFDTVHLRAAEMSGGMKLLGEKPVGDRRPVDRFVGHGMGCAGIIGALGEDIPPGLAGACQILPIRVLGAAEMPGRPTPVGIGAIADIDAGLKLAVDLGAKILNMSFGTADDALDPAAPRPHADVVRYAALRGCVLIAASGNSGRTETYWPAGYDDVIAAGSVDSDGRVSGFSTRGPHVALCAPGERIATAGLSGYQLATGTSFAAPFVAAAASLLVSRAVGRSYPIDGALVRRLLVAGASPFAGTEVGAGAGILNAYASLQALDQAIDAEAGGAGPLAT